jgi:RND family efflux transporter MFP subunit
MSMPAESRHTLHATALCVVMLSGACAFAADPAAATNPAARVQTIAARQGPLAQQVHAYGSIGFSAADLVTLNVPYAAQVTRLAVSVGQPVKKGAVLAEVVADPAVAATFVQAQSGLKASRDEFRRTQSLYDKQLATQSQLAAAQKAVSDAEVTVSELARQGAQPGPRPLVAPFDGVVVNVAAAQGDRVAAGASVLQIGRDSKAGAARATVGVDPSQASQVRPGAPARVASLDRGSASGAPDAPAYAGRVAAVRQILNPQTRLVDVAVALDASAGTPPLSGTLVRADIEIARGTHWIVPRAAVLQDAAGDYIYQVAAGRAHRIGVTKQVESGDQYGVDGALVAGQPVVVEGNYELTDGMAVVEAEAGR